MHVAQAAAALKPLLKSDTPVLSIQVAYTREFASKIPRAKPSVLLDLLAKRTNEAITALVHARERQLGCRS